MKRKRLPPWFKIRIANNKNFAEVRGIVKREKLHTVCESARCPNLWECWSRRTATFMILGDTCTRHCRFCAVSSGKPGAFMDSNEPARVAGAIQKLGILHAVITSVTRDDLPDGGAGIFAETIRQIRAQAKSCAIEVLIPDFLEHLQPVLDAEPDILNHNLETVPRLYKKVRPEASYERSLDILHTAKRAGAVVKTGLMVGLGETIEEISSVFSGLQGVKCDILSIGQYLQPTRSHLLVEKYYTPKEFTMLKQEANSFGIKHVESGPMVRSSYHAELYGHEKKTSR